MGTHNNPSNIALAEIQRIWQQRPVGCHLSIGAGKQDIVSYNGDPVDVERLLSNYENTSRDVYEHYRRTYGTDGPYFRLSVDRGLSSTRPGLMDDIPGITSGFLREPEQQDRMARCVRALGNADTSLTDGVFENRFDGLSVVIFYFSMFYRGEIASPRLAECCSHPLSSWL